MPKDFDYVVLDNDKTFETSPGNPIQLDTPKWFSWLADGENNSFRFNADDNSYRARKEYNKAQDTHYWYAVKKVNGRLHKKFIGKSEQVTHDRLCEVAKTITVPPKSKQHTTDIDNQSTHTINTPTLQELVNQIQELTNRLDNLESRGEDATAKKPEYLPSEELEARIGELERLTKELTKELSSEQIKVDSLSKNLQHREDNFPYSLEYIKQFGDFYMDALRHKEKLPSSEVDNYKLEVKKFINFIEANRKVPSPSGGFSHGMDFDLRKGEDIISLSSYLNELTSELANKDGQLQELTNNIANLNSKLTELTNELAKKDRELQELKASVPSPQSPITNTQPVEAEGRSQEAGENLTAGGDGGECDRTYQNIPLEELHLTTSVYNILKRQQINSIGDLFNYSEDELLQAWNFGQKALNQVKEQLKIRLGLDFPQSTPGEDGENSDRQKPKINLHDGSRIEISEKQEQILILLGLLPHTHHVLTSQFLAICKENLTNNRGELESLINKEISSKGSTIRKTTAVLRGAGFVLSGSETDGYEIIGLK
ncbi:DNA-directed RNA polymerase subunit alpha C-terminal domain-containing protein [Anabaena sp. WFMT]|uniref:DNA-directed RNA polymerase subunit alpha C-terminal domain-containing protein n=1 Tax=Anabaena sp. WFMT TaxID=3449730 RepID=UPI003F208036